MPKAGTLLKNSEIGSSTLSKPFRIYAASAPSRLPSSQPTSMAGSCSATVQSMALEMMSLTRRGYWLKEVPKSPLNRFFTKMKNWVIMGLSVPNSAW